MRDGCATGTTADARRLRLAAGLLAGLVSAGLVGGAQPAGAAPVGPKVLVRTTGNNSELRKSIRVERHAGGRHVIMSMSPRQLPGLEPGDRLNATAELQVTDDCLYRSPRCAGTPYHFDPIIDSRIMLTRGKHVTGGPGAVTLAHKRITCTQDNPEREHHCTIVFTHAPIRVRSRRSLPCRPTRCHLNYVLSAHNHRARRGDRLVIGGNLPDGRIRQDKGRLNAIRFHQAAHLHVPTHVSHARVHRHVPLDEHFVVIFSQRLRHLERNDQLAVNARWATTVRRLPYIVRLTSQLVLTAGRYKTAPNGFVKRISLLKGEVSESNGSNCIHRPRCVRRKTGVLRIRHSNVRHRGHRVPIYVNLVAKSNPKAASRRAGDRLPVLRTGGIRVTRYPAALRG